MRRLRALLLFSIATYVMMGSQALACPFCSAVSQTFSEEMGTMDVVAIAELVQAGEYKKLTADGQSEIPKSKFQITKVIKGDAFIKVGDHFETIYFGEKKKDRAFLAMAADAPNLTWSTPLILTDSAKQYLGHLKDLPKGGAKRLEFFQDYLEDEDEMLARDAYDEFAKAPYKDVIDLKTAMNHDQLIKFVKDPDVPSNRRRLYFTMLGVCGTKEDAKLLEQFMSSTDRKKKAGLDSMLACYMILNGQDGLDRVDELFLKNKAAEYADTYAAIMAIRFHGSETDVIPRKRLMKSLRHMLDRPELADLVIPDLARWEDWEVLPKLVDLFVTADENSSWVRVPVINYLRACPLPIAAEKIEELKKIDPDSVKRAMTFFPLTTEKDSDDAEKKETKPTETDEQADVDVQAAPTATSLRTPVPSPSAGTPHVELTGSRETEVAQTTRPDLTSSLPPRVNKSESLNSIETPDTLTQIEKRADTGTNLGVLMGVTLCGGCLCFVAMRSILGLG